MTAALRWRLAVTVRSLRLVPPLLGLCAYLGIFLTQRNQAWPSIVAVDVMFAFALALWVSVAHTGALSRGHREITQATVGRPSAFAAEVVGSALLAFGAVIVMIAWALALQLASPAPSVGSVAGAVGATVAAALTGAAAGQLLDAARLRPPARFIVAIGLLTLTVARPSITVVASWPLPPVMDLAKAINDQRVGATWWWSVVAALWAVVAVVVAYLVEDRFPATDRTS